MSLAAMAARTHYSKPLLGLLETDKRTIRDEHVVAYSRALNVSVKHLYGPSSHPLRVAHEWLVADSPVVVQRNSGRRVGGSLAEELEARVIELRHLDDYIGGRDLIGLVRKELFYAQRLVREASYPEGIGRRFLTVVGELAQLAGWVASDAGLYVEAERIYLSGVSAAREAANSALAGQLLSSLSYQMANVGNPADAALLARSAVTGVGRMTPVVRALLLERVAWASARSRDEDGSRRALDAVDESFADRSDGIEEPEWVYWLDRREIDVMAGRCLIELGEPARAEPLLARAISDYATDHVREVALYETWLAESYARSREFDGAEASIRRARRAAKKVNSARLEVRIAEVERLLDVDTRNANGS